MSVPKVSIVVTAFNSEQYLAEALQSVTEQSFENWELIVVDDGSDDDSARRICDDFEQGCRNTVRYIYKKNGGPSSARNAGLSEASGEYISFLDADDYFMSEKLAIQVALLDTLGPDYGFVIGCSEKFKDEEGDGIISCPDEVDGYVDVELFVRGNTRIEGTPGFLFLRRALLAVKGFDETLRNNEDFDLILRIGHRYKLKSHRDVVFRQRLRPDSLSQGDPVSGLNGSLAFASKIASLYPHVPDSAIKRQRQRAYFNAAKAFLRRKKYRNYLWLIRQGREAGGALSSLRGYVAYCTAWPFLWLATKPEGIEHR